MVPFIFFIEELCDMLKELLIFAKFVEVEMSISHFSISSVFTASLDEYVRIEYFYGASLLKQVKQSSFDFVAM